MVVWPNRRDARSSPAFIQSRAVTGRYIKTALPELHRGRSRPPESLQVMADLAATEAFGVGGAASFQPACASACAEASSGIP